MSRISAKSIINQGDNLPFGYLHPDCDGKLIWMCGEDSIGQITSVFEFTDKNGNKDKKPTYLSDIEEAKKNRQLLIDEGWVEIKAPDVTFTYGDGKEKSDLNRGEKRRMAKYIKKSNSNNPFTQD